MEQPFGFAQPGEEHKVCRLLKSLYGLKQASHQWNAKIHEVLMALRFVRTTSDSGIYVNTASSKPLIIILYVDDIVILGGSLDEVLKCKAAMAASFDMMDLGEINSYSEQKNRCNVCNVSLVCRISLPPGWLLKHINFH